MSIRSNKSSTLQQGYNYNHNSGVGKKNETPAQQRGNVQKKGMNHHKHRKPAGGGKVHDLTTNNVVPTSSSSIPIATSMDPNSMYWLCSSVVYTAIAKGFQSVCANQSQPYWSFVYLAKSISALMTNQTPKSLLLPKCIADVVIHLMIQIVPYGRGKWNYSMLPMFDPSSFQAWGNAGPTTREINLFFPGTTYLNGVWPIMVAPSPYNDDLGQQAFNLLVTYLTGLNVDGKMPHLELVDVIDMYNNMVPDSSAFSFNLILIGGEAGKCSGFHAMAMSETPITKPLLSCFLTTPSNSIAKTRDAVHGMPTSGSSGMLFPLLIQQSPPFSISEKRYPVFLPYDFGELVMRIAVYVNQLANVSANDYQSQNRPLTDFTINMTPQDFSLLIRAVVMNIFDTSQLAGQFTYPQSAGFLSSVFEPFVAGSGTGPFGIVGSSLKLPQEYWEMIYACTMRRYGSTGELLIPVWGIYTSLYPDLGSYNVKRGEETLPLFKIPDAYIHPKDLPKNRKYSASELMFGLGEVPIKLPDLSFPGPQNYIQGNDPKVIMVLTAIFNEFLMMSGANTGILATVSVNSGASRLATIGNWILKISDNNLDEQQVKLYERMRKHIVIAGIDPYAYEQVVIKVFRDAPLSALMELQGVWMLACYVFLVNGSVDETTSIRKLKAYTDAIYSIPDSPVGNSISLYDEAVIQATRNTKERDTDRTVADSVLLDLEEKGQGGILVDMAQALLGAFVGGRPNVH